MNRKPKRLMIFAHFSRRGAVSASVMQAMTSYRRHIDLICFVSASPISAVERKALSDQCNKVSIRRNIGYDFFSWKHGLEIVGDLLRFDEIILVNDSVIGPLSDPQSIFERLSHNQNDVCGLTLNWEHGRHAQSYFVRYKSSVVESGAFDAFWKTIELLEDKKSVVLAYEVGISQFMEARGHSVGALFEPPETMTMSSRLWLWARAARPTEPVRTVMALRFLLGHRQMNPVHHLWEQVLDDGISFVKKELIRDNPLCVDRSAVFAALHDRYGLKRQDVVDLAQY